MRALFPQQKNRSAPSKRVLTSENICSQNTSAFLEATMTEEKLSAYSWFHKGVELHSSGQYREALVLIEKALKLFQSQEHTADEQGSCHFYLGWIMRDQGRLNSARGHYMQALRIFRSLPNTSGEQADCLIGLGNTLRAHGDPIAAANLHTSALSVYRTIENSEYEQAKCLMNIGNALRDQGSLEQAYVHYIQALQTFQMQGNTELDQARCAVNLGNTLYALKRYAPAENFLSQAFTLYESIPNKESEQAICLMQLGDLSAVRGDLGLVIHHYTRALEMLTKLEASERSRVRCLLDLSMLMLSLDYPFDDEIADNIAVASALLEKIESPRLREDLDITLTLLQRATAFRQGIPEPKILVEALSRILPIAVRNDERRFGLDSAQKRRQWIENIAEPRMNLALLLAEDANRPQLIAELVAKWRLGGRIEKRALEAKNSAPAPQPTNTETYGDELNARPGNLQAISPVPLVTFTEESLEHWFHIQSANFNTPTNITTHRNPGPLLQMPYGNRCEIAEHIPDADSRPHAKYR